MSGLLQAADALCTKLELIRDSRQGARLFLDEEPWVGKDLVCLRLAIEEESSRLARQEASTLQEVANV